MFLIAHLKNAEEAKTIRRLTHGVSLFVPDIYKTCTANIIINVVSNQDMINVVPCLI